MKIVKSDCTEPIPLPHPPPNPESGCLDHQVDRFEYPNAGDRADDQKADSRVTGNEEGEIVEKAAEKGKAEGKEENEEGLDEAIWPYFVETTLDKLDFEARKWLLFQLVCYEPVFLEEVKLGFPMSLVPNEPRDEEVEEEGTMNKCKGKEKEKEQVGEVDEKYRFMEVKLPKEEWLLTYCQIDSIPSSDRDEFLLNIFLMSLAHAKILSTFHSRLEAGREIQEVYGTQGDICREEEMETWKKAFRRRMDGRKVRARSDMGVEYGSVEAWEEMSRDREGVWDVALSEVGAWLMRTLPVSNEYDHGLCQDTMSDQDELGKKDQVFDRPSEGLKNAQAHVEIMAFTCENKILSLLRQITRPDSASDTFPGRSRYNVLAITDLINLCVLISRSHIELRRLLGGVVESVSAEIIVLLGELEEAEVEWIRVDEDLAWGVECVGMGLENVGLDSAWTGVECIRTGIIG